MSKSIENRIESIEEKLGANREHQTIQIVRFGDVELPPERTENGITVKFVRYAEGD